LSLKFIIFKPRLELAKFSAKMPPDNDDADAVDVMGVFMELNFANLDKALAGFITF
jgi:hypothetical protein